MTSPAPATTGLERPVIILGAERSGTTLLYSMLANHPDLYWLSRLDNRFPRATRSICLLRRLGALGVRPRPHGALTGTIARSAGFNPPSEGVSYWRLIFRWGDEDDYRVENDAFDETFLTSDLRDRIRSDLGLRMLLLRKSRLLLKQPGFALKIPFFSALFPDAVFVHSVRQPLTNLMSLIRAKQQSDVRFWGTKIPGWQEMVDAPAEVQAARQLAVVAKTIAADVQRLRLGETRYVQVRFEDLTTHPEAAVRAVLARCGLPVDEAAVARAALAPEPRTDQDQQDSTLSWPAEVHTIVRELQSAYGYADG